MKTLHTKTHDGTPIIVMQWAMDQPHSVNASQRMVSEFNSQGYTVAQITGNGKQWNVILTKEPKV